MRDYLKPAFATVIVSVILLALFKWWAFHAGASSGESQLVQIDSFESNGIPQFAFKEYNGTSGDTSQFKGKVLIVNFWASWCGPCLEEMPSLISLIESQGGKVELLAVSADYTKDDLESFFKSYPKASSANIHIVWDEDNSIAKKFSVDRLPESFVVGKNFRLVKKIIGSINWHTDESAAFMSALTAK